MTTARWKLEIKPITDSVCRCDLKYKAVEYSMMQLLANDTPVPLRPVP